MQPVTVNRLPAPALNETARPEPPQALGGAGAIMLSWSRFTKMTI